MSDWSVRGATILLDKPEGALLTVGKSGAAMLLFKLDSFTLQIPMQISVKHVDPAKKRVGIVFQDMSPRQLSVMQQLVSGYINGELVSVSDFIHVVERNNFVKQRSMPKAGPLSPSEKTSILLRKTLVFGGALVLLTLLFLSIYERNFIIEASNAYVDAGGFTVNTPSGGTVMYNNIDQGDTVKTGTPLATIQSRTGNNSTLASPCNCVVNQLLVAQGNIANEGDSILTLVPKEALTFITAYLPYEQAKKLREGQEAQVALAGKSIRHTGKINYISNQAATKDNLYKLRIATTDRIDPSLLGTPVHVTFDTLR
jgi:mannuronan synthase